MTAAIERTNTMRHPVAPDQAAILDTLDALLLPDAIVELRALFLKGKKRTVSGYFDGAHREALAEHAVRFNNAGAAVYVPLNPINPQLLARYCNRMQDYADKTTSDAEVTARRWLLLDFDPVRPAGTSATDAQLSEARAVSDACLAELQSRGWPAPIVAESGNGMHLLYPLDLPNDADSRDLVKGALSGLATRFDTRRITLDQTVFNAGRITKLYGTVANKGDPTPATPWRLSRVLFVPVRESVVSVEQLREWVPVTAHPVRHGYTPVEALTASRSSFDLDTFLSRLGIPFVHDAHEGADRYKLAHCPFNLEHGKGEAAIFRHADGGLGFKCQHNSCADRHWQDVRNLVDPDRPRVASATAAPEAPQGAQAGAMHVDDGERRAGAYGASWIDPRPLSVKLGPEPYPLDALPEVIRAAVSEARDYYQAPLPVVVASALSALSVAVQGVADVRRDEKLVGPSGIYMLTIAESGERKSACDKHFSTVLRDWQENARLEAAPEVAEYRARLAIWKAKHAGVTEAIKANAKGKKSTVDLEQQLRDLEDDTPAPPLHPTPLRGDDTPENLAWALMKEWPSAGVLSSEAGTVFGSHGMGKESIMRNLALLATLWDGGSQSVGRRTSESFVMKGARFTLGLMVQESTLRTFVSGTDGLARDMGFLARFLVAWPESTQGHRPYREPAGFPHLARFNAAIQNVMRTELRHEPTGGIQPAVLDLSAEGKALWRNYHDAIEESLRPRGELCDVRDVASKAAENIARLATLFHVLEHGPAGAMGPESVMAAARVMLWHLNESRRFFGELALPRDLADAARLDDWLLDHCRREGTLTVPTRTVQRYGPGSLRHKIGAIESAVSVLTELHRARLRIEGKRKDIEVNPALVLGG